MTEITASGGSMSNRTRFHIAGLALLALVLAVGGTNLYLKMLAPMFDPPKWTVEQQVRIDLKRRQLKVGLPTGTLVEYTDGRLRSVPYAPPIGSRVPFMDNFGLIHRRGPDDEEWLGQVSRFVRPTDADYPAMAVKFFEQKDEPYLRD